MSQGQRGNEAPALNERRLIERPRLLKLLDDSEARVILLNAPAGYGKSTLVHQWIGRNDGILFTVGIGDTDVAALARGLATAVSRDAPGLERHVDEAVRAIANPAKQVDDVARAFLAAIEGAEVACVAIDDYHVIASTPPAERFIEMLEASRRFRLLVASRVRPRWVTARRIVYGDVFELTQAELALDSTETAQILETAAVDVPTTLRERARGWPAVIGLAAVAGRPGAPPRDSISTTLYDFFAQEIFGRLSHRVQDVLFDLALLPSSSHEELARRLRDRSRTALETATASGLATDSRGVIDVHPLARDFLVAKLRSAGDVESPVRAAVDYATEQGRWAHGFALIREFGLLDDFESFVTHAFVPLLREGRVTTLESIVQYARVSGGLSTALVNLLTAAVAGASEDQALAQSLAEDAIAGLPSGHELIPRSYMIAGAAAYLQQHLVPAYDFNARALEVATSSVDRAEALWGRCLAGVFLERDIETVTAEFIEGASASPEDQLRVLMAREHQGRFALGLFDVTRYGAIAEPLLELCRDPRIRTSWKHTHGYCLILGANYSEAERFLNEAIAEIERFGLAFARLHLQWSLAAAAAGLRKFTAADERLRAVERHVGQAVNPHLDLNSRALRARLLMMQHRVQDALRYVSDDAESASSPGMYGEYLGVQALAHALASDNRRANTAAEAAQAATRAIEGTTYAAAARAVTALNTPSAVDAARTLLGTARDLGAWDAFVCAVRASAPLAQVLGALDGEQATLVRVLTRSGDHALIRSLGLTRGAPYTRGAPLLTPRELEIIDLLRQGLRNKEIARTLFISEATVKVHVQHIREKLGARTRAEAVARYAEIAADDTS